jgi:hypothetical protein
MRWGGVPGLARLAIATWAVFAVQVIVGVQSARLDSAAANGVHVALATLVWMGMLTTALLALPRADREAQLSRLAVEKRSA